MGTAMTGLSISFDELADHSTLPTHRFYPAPPTWGTVPVDLMDLSVRFGPKRLRVSDLRLQLVIHGTKIE